MTLASSSVGSESEVLGHPRAKERQIPVPAPQGVRAVRAEGQAATHAAEPRMSPDPLSPTDRYRLVTPWTLSL